MKSRIGGMCVWRENRGALLALLVLPWWDVFDPLALGSEWLFLYWCASAVRSSVGLFSELKNICLRLSNSFWMYLGFCLLRINKIFGYSSLRVPAPRSLQ